jgi:hypothetical protein
MPKVSSYTSKTRRLVIPFEEDDDEPLTVVYRPRGLKTETLTQLQAAKATEQFDQLVCVQIIALVESWDLTDEDGTPVPITPESLAAIPVTLLSHVFDKINEDIRPNPARSSTSLNGSAPKATEDRAPTGSSSFD